MNKASLSIILGIYQLLGGLLGIGLIIHYHYSAGGSSLLFLFLPVLAGLFFLYSTLCGVLCLRNHELALSLSSVNQLLQLISFSVSRFLFDYTAGIFFSINIGLGNGSSFDWESGFSRMHFRYDVPEGVTAIGINLVAVILLIMIDAIKTRPANRNAGN